MLDQDDGLDAGRPAAPIRVFMTPCFSAVETPEVGSSSRITSGLSAKAEATSSSFFSPCESRRETVCRRCSSPKMRGDLLDARAHLGIAGQAREQPPLLALLRHHGGGDGLGDGELREDLHELERARHAALGQLHRPDAGDVVALEEHLALGRHQQAGQQIDQRGLAGAVRAHDRHELAVGDRHA